MKRTHSSFNSFISILKTPLSRKKMPWDLPIYSSDSNHHENMNIAIADINSRASEHTFSYRNYTCKISLTSRDTWNGYIEINPFHVCYGIDHTNTLKTSDEFYLSVHGGLSYSYTDKKGTVLGFHTGHIGDFIPSILPQDVNCNFHYSTFRKFNWVKKQLRKLAEQLYFYNENIEGISILFKEEEDEFID